MLCLFPMQVCMVRNWCVQNLFPVKGFLKPAAYECGSLEACPRSSVASSEYSTSSEECSPRPASLDDLKAGSWSPAKSEC